MFKNRFCVSSSFEMCHVTFYSNRIWKFLERYDRNITFSNLLLDTIRNENEFNDDFVMLSELIINGRLIDLMGFRYNKFTII